MGEKSSHSFLEDSNAGERLPQIIRTLLQALQDLAYVPQPMVAMHLAILSLCSVKGEKSKEEAVVQKKEVQQAPVIKQPVKAEPAQIQTTVVNTETPKPAAGNFSVDEVKVVWGELIDSVKKNNPVASTFLRAMEPIEVSDDIITLRARYTLHRNFFNTSKNSKLITDILTKLLGQNVGVKCFLDEANGTNGGSVVNQRQDQEKKFQETVGQVFG